ncbi:MAG TPA: hypothetical protein VFC68_03720, partial [Treponemataceae bacterium]|nr:hypothetical protein [Treponemataceae bacterium]
MNKRNVCFLLLLFSSAFIIANPLLSPKKTPPTDSENSTSQEKNTSILPVRTTGGNPDIIKKQGNLRENLANVFVQIQKNSLDNTSNASLFLVVILFSFAYGVLHAVGPGHRKTIVFSLYLTRTAPWWEPGILSVLLAVLHGGTAIILMLVFKGIAGSISQNTKNITMLMEGITYIIIIVTTIWLIIHETIEY